MVSTTAPSATMVATDPTTVAPEPTTVARGSTTTRPPKPDSGNPAKSPNSGNPAKGPDSGNPAKGVAGPLPPQRYPHGAVVRATLTIPARPEHVATARRFVIAALGDDHPQADTATLLTSELVTNSLQHSASAHDGAILAVGASRAAHWLRVEVVDDGAPALPALREAATDAERGRGLTLVDTLATRWGTQRTDTGTTTWFEIAS